MTDNPLLYPGAAHPDLREPMIAELVRTFYARARQDKLIGPVFAAAVEDWDHHIGKITDFWSGVMLRTGRYDGRPMRPHLILPLEGKHFDRWLDRPLGALRPSAAALAERIALEAGADRGEIATFLSREARAA